MGKRIFSRRGGWSYHISTAYRSGLEETIAEQIRQAGIIVAYENASISYLRPASKHVYTPDFVLPNGIIIETKGVFETSDRKKHELIKKEYPHLDIRFIFSNPSQKIYKGSLTSYAAWCEKGGFLYAKGVIPAEWFKESPKDTTGLQQKKERSKSKSNC